MSDEIKVYAADCLNNLIIQIYKWSGEGLESVEVSITDLILHANHVEDLEMELLLPLNAKIKISDWTESSWSELGAKTNDAYFVLCLKCTILDNFEIEDNNSRLSVLRACVKSVYELYPQDKSVEKLAHKLELLI